MTALTFLQFDTQMKKLGAQYCMVKNRLWYLLLLGALLNALLPKTLLAQNQEVTEYFLLGHTLSSTIINDSELPKLRLVGLESEFEISPVCPMSWQEKKISLAEYAIFEAVIEQYFNRYLNIFSDKLSTEACRESFDYLKLELIENRNYAGLIANVMLDSERQLVSNFYQAWSFERVLPPVIRSVTNFGPPIQGPALFVTHASSVFDAHKKSKAGIDNAIDWFKRRSLPVVFVMNNDSVLDFAWLTGDREPTLAISSVNGDHELSTQGDSLTVSGGFFSLCMDRTVSALIRHHTFSPSRKLSINILMSGVYVEKNLFPVPVNNRPAIAWKFGIDYYPTLSEVLDNVGTRVFLLGVEQILKTYADKYRVTIRLPGMRTRRYGSRGKRIIFNFVKDIADLPEAR